MVGDRHASLLSDHFSTVPSEHQRPVPGGELGVFFVATIDPLSMTDPERKLLRRFLQAEWEKTKAAYREAGAPFGWGRGLDIWVEHGQLTTMN